MMAEKESLMDQFEPIAERKAVIDRAQEPLLKELNDIKKQIDTFNDRRQNAQVGVFSVFLFVSIIYCPPSGSSCTSC